MAVNIEVYHNDTTGKWSVSKEGRVSSTHRLKQSAEDSGRKLAKKSSPSQLTVYNMRGSISYRQFYE